MGLAGRRAARTTPARTHSGALTPRNYLVAPAVIGSIVHNPSPSRSHRYPEHANRASTVRRTEEMPPMWVNITSGCITTPAIARPATHHGQTRSPASSPPRPPPCRTELAAAARARR